jgi:hypothetical protein
MSDINVLALVGSLRAASVNHQIAALAAETAPAGITVTVYHGLGAGLGELPLYNEDIDNPADLPASAGTLRDAVAHADAILVVTPEYNGSIPGALKNAIDWLSRHYQQNALLGQAAGRHRRRHGPVRRRMGTRRDPQIIRDRRGRRCRCARALAAHRRTRGQTPAREPRRGRQPQRRINQTRRRSGLTRLV